MRITYAMDGMDGQMYPIGRSDCHVATRTVPDCNRGTVLDDCNDF